MLGAGRQPPESPRSEISRARAPSPSLLSSGRSAAVSYGAVVPSTTATSPQTNGGVASFQRRPFASFS